MKKNFKLVLALVLALSLFASMTAAFADVTISISQDSTYAGTADEAGRAYTYYKVFSASYGNDYTGNTGNDGGYDSDGTPGAVSGDSTHPVSYTATPAVAAMLGTIDGTTHAWTTNAGNLWFDLTYIPGTGNYSVKWRKNVNTDADTAQAAAKWLKTNSVYESGKTGSLTWDSTDKAWEATGLEEGYYIISSETGDNLIAATTNVAIKEKNAYPPHDKTQADEDNTTQNHTTRPVAVGDKLTYEVKVTVPNTAKVGDKILVWDKPSSGLSYDNNVAVKNGTNTGSATIEDVALTDSKVPSGSVWAKMITVNAASKGTDIIFTFTMTVTSAALTDVDKENESGLKYGNGSDWNYESIPVKVEYKTYFAGIHKVDLNDNTKDLEGVKFTLTENDSPFYVQKVSGQNYYIPIADPATNNMSDEEKAAARLAAQTVETASDGTIRIRGLDNEKTYKLTEIETNDGYNLLDAPVTLTLSEDTVEKYVEATQFDSAATYYAEVGDVMTEQTIVDADAFAAFNGTLYTRTATNSYDGKTKDQFQKVENGKGSTLPATGGIGTTIFYIGGSILVLAAAILLITKRRMSNND